MNSSLGRITARLADPVEDLSPDLIDRLNQNIAPPTPLTGDDVYIGSMYIVSDEVNSYGGRFPGDEHPRMAQLLIDSPVMVGHRKDKLPVGRNFHAELITRDGKNWIASYFYWLRDADGAANLKSNIDGGVYKECSIGFTFRKPECGICGEDIRLCRHEPFQTYAGPDGEQVCYFNYRQIERILETSLVYRGATPHTSVTRTTAGSAEVDCPDSGFLAPIHDLSGLDDDGIYLVVPRYESIPVTAECRGGRLSLVRIDGTPIAPEIANRFDPSDLPGGFVSPARLIGLHGKERCAEPEIEAFLRDGSGPVSRLVLRVFPCSLPNLNITNNAASTFDIRLMPHRRAAKSQIDRCAREIAARLGVEIWPENRAEAHAGGYAYMPPSPERQTGYSLSVPGAGDDATLTVNAGGGTFTFRIKGFDRRLFAGGRRFVADLLPESEISSVPRGAALTGAVELVQTCGAGFRVSVTGDLAGKLIFRPIRLMGKDRFLFYRAGDGRSSQEETAK